MNKRMFSQSGEAAVVKPPPSLNPHESTLDPHHNLLTCVLAVFPSAFLSTPKEKQNNNTVSHELLSPFLYFHYTKYTKAILLTLV